MKNHIITFGLLLSFFTAHSQQKIIVKISQLKGDKFYAGNLDLNDYKNVVELSLKQKGFQVITENIPTEDIYFMDIILFQYFANYPSIILTIRSKNGTHFIDQEKTKFYLSVKSAFQKILNEIVERIPSSINNTLYYFPKYDNLISNTRFNLEHFLIKKTVNLILPKYPINLVWPENKSVEFLFPDELPLYIDKATNFYDIRKFIKKNHIKIVLKIDLNGKFEIKEIISPSEINEKQKLKFNDFINAFPLWIVNEPIENIELEAGLEP